MIYFIQDTGSKAIKIGISGNPVKRLAALQTAHPSRLILLGVMDGWQFEERALHQRFDRLQGEWFKPTEELLEYIKTNAKPLPVQNEGHAWWEYAIGFGLAVVLILFSR